jgi:hypothetical protein
MNAAEKRIPLTGLKMARQGKEPTSAGRDPRLILLDCVPFLMKRELLRQRQGGEPGIEHLPVQQFVPQLAVERLQMSLLPGAAGLDAERAYALVDNALLPPHALVLQNEQHGRQH